METFKHTRLSFALLLVLMAQPVVGQELHIFQEGSKPRWISPENLTGAPGQGGQENKGAKGHAYQTLKAGESLVLADIKGQGIIRRMWITINDRSPEMLRGLKFEIFWDGATTPAVAAPFGDFFGDALGRTYPFENALFTNAEGRSFVFRIPMPFRTGARFVLTNELDRDLGNVFYDIDYTMEEDLPDDAMYFHAHWRRENPTTLEKEYAILPDVKGRGRFLGTLVGLVTDSTYGTTWWGEGEIKMYLDGDGDHATLVGTGTEDYIGTGWGQGKFINLYQGAPLAGDNREWAYYRFHVTDPVFFEESCRVTVQPLGGMHKPDVVAMLERGVRLVPVTVDPGRRDTFVKLLEQNPVPSLTDPSLPLGWTNFWREDDYSSVAYFYLDRAESGLPPLAPVAERIRDLGPVTAP